MELKRSDLYYVQYGLDMKWMLCVFLYFASYYVVLRYVIRRRQSSLVWSKILSRKMGLNQSNSMWRWAEFELWIDRFLILLLELSRRKVCFCLLLLQWVNYMSITTCRVVCFPIFSFRLFSAKRDIHCFIDREDNKTRKDTKRNFI